MVGIFFLMWGGWYLFVLHCFGLVGGVLLFLSLQFCVRSLESLCGVGDLDWTLFILLLFLFSSAQGPFG